MSSLHPLTPVPHPSPLRDRVSPWLLSTALFAAPIAWFVQLNISVLLGMNRCSSLREDAASSLVTGGLVAVGLAALLIVLVALWAAGGANLEVVTIRGGRRSPQRADPRSRPDPVPGAGRTDREFHVPDRRRLFADHSVAGRLMSILIRLTALAATLAFSPASAHGGAHAEAAGWSSWFADPTVSIILAVAAVLYLARIGSNAVPAFWTMAGLEMARVTSFVCALAVIALALLSPIDAFAEKLFSVHMAQHLLLVLVAAPMIALSNAQLVYLWLLPMQARRWTGRAIDPIPGVKQAMNANVTAWVVCAAFVGSLWFWHAPATYDWALANKWGHASEHLVLLATSTAFWRVVVTSSERRLSPGMMILMVSLVGLQGSFLAALITFAPRPLYAAYAANSIDDQALGGVLMCIPASFLYLGSTIWALSRC